MQTILEILEQCQEWKTTCHVKFIDFEKAFGSIHRESLWCVLRHYGIPCKIVTFKKMFFERFNQDKCDLLPTTETDNIEFA